MTRVALIHVVVALVILLIGHFALQAIGWGLAKSRSLSEWLWKVYWIYPSDIPRENIRRNKLAYLVVVIVAYVLTTAY
jgi:hypothetical protein